jgi:choline dehydrogenase-like flavoprotein
MISDVLWQRPCREEFDVWGTELGNGPTWSFDALEPYYRKAENWTGPPITTLPGGQTDDALGEAFGRDGPMQISYNNYYPDLIEESVAAANVLGATTSSNPVSPPSSPTKGRALGGGRRDCFGITLNFARCYLPVGNWQRHRLLHSRQSGRPSIRNSVLFPHGVFRAKCQQKKPCRAHRRRSHQDLVQAQDRLGGR